MEEYTAPRYIYLGYVPIDVRISSTDDDSSFVAEIPIKIGDWWMI